jgi:hypothetical protein
MLEGRSIALRRNGQTTVATWIAVMVAVSEYVNEEMIAISEHDRRWLYAKGRPPSSRWRIFIGAHRRQEHPLFTHNVMSLGTEEEFERLAGKTPANPNAQTTTICLGNHLVIHVMSTGGVWGFVRRWQLASNIRDSVTQIWPIAASAIAWPPATALTDAGLEILSQRFFNVISQVARNYDLIR